MGLFIQHDPMSKELAELAPGTHRRADVTALLGEPLASFPERGVDLFERGGKLTDLLFPGIPYTTQWTFHTLISYDATETLTGIDTGGNAYRSTLSAGRFRYHMPYPGTLLEFEDKPAFETRAGACSMVLLAVGSRWSDKLYYRDPIRVNDLVIPGLRGFDSYRYLVVEPGPQSLSATWSSRSGPWSETRTFECADGTLIYVTLIPDRGSAIHIANSRPAELEGRALVLYPNPSLIGARSTER